LELEVEVESFKTTSTFYKVEFSVSISTRLRYWQGNELAMHRSRVRRGLAAQYCVVAFDKLYLHLSNQTV